MFFTDLKNWKQSTLFWAYVITTTLYLSLVAVAPCIVVYMKYDIGHSGDNAISGIAIVFIMLCAILSLHFGKRIVSKMPQITQKQQRFKFTAQFILAMIMPVAVIIILYLAKSNFKLAYSTIKIIVWFIIAGVVVDYFALKYIDAERDLRFKAMEQIEINNRVNTLTKKH